MGKGKRTRVNSELERKIAEAKAAEVKTFKKKSRLKATLAIVIIVAIVGAAIGGSVGYTHLKKNGHFLRNKTAVSTSDHKVTSTMVQYLYNSTLNNFAESNAAYLSDLGLDTTKSLKEQECYYDEELSWHDYFMNTVKSQFEEIVAMAQAGTDAGLKLQDADFAYIDESLAMFDELASDEGLTTREYLTKYYGTEVSIEDVRDCLEMTQLASNYKVQLEDSFKYNDVEINSYFEENKSEFLTCDYINILVSNNATGKESDKELELLNAEAEKIAKRLAKADSVTEFKENISEYYQKALKSAVPDASDEDIEAQIESVISNSTYQGEGYDVSSDAGEWLFAENREIGDTTIMKSDEGYNVYCLISPAVKDTAETKNIRHIFFDFDKFDDESDCKKEADRLLKEWRNGEKTEESFAELAKEFSQDIASSQSGGLYKNLTQGVMPEAFDTWTFAKSRKSGDTEVIKTDNGWHVMYFVSDGHISWKAQVVTSMIAADYNEKLTKLKEKYNIKSNDSNFNKAKQIIKEVTSSGTASATA